MTDAKRLLAEATPLPWTHVRIRDDHDELAGAVFADHPDGALLLHAVNRLPDYLAAVDILAALMVLPGYHADGCFIHTPALTTCECGVQQGRIAAKEALNRLSQGVAV